MGRGLREVAAEPTPRPCLPRQLGYAVSRGGILQELGLKKKRGVWNRGWALLRAEEPEATEEEPRRAEVRLNLLKD